jgi:metallo-beta-lactamase family protein
MKHIELMDTEARGLMQWLKRGQNVPRVQFTESVEDSMALNHIHHGAIIISASGMCNAGRVKQHLKFNLPRAECTVIIAGFQAQGTLGRKLVDHAASVRIFQEWVPVHADIYTLGGLSAHADQAALMAWLKHFKTPPRQTFVVHGEEETALGFGALIQKELDWSVAVPTAGTVVDC